MTTHQTEGPDEALVEVPIGGLMTPVPAAAWERDPAKVEAEVMAAREALRLGDDVEEAPDFDTLVGDEPEVIEDDDVYDLDPDEPEVEALGDSDEEATS